MKAEGVSDEVCGGRGLVPPALLSEYRFSPCLLIMREGLYHLLRVLQTP